MVRRPAAGRKGKSGGGCHLRVALAAVSAPALFVVHHSIRLHSFPKELD